MNASIEEAARLYTARDLPRAARVCLDILRDTPKHFDALHLLGAICTSRGQHADGVSYLLRAAAVNPNDARLQANLGGAWGTVQRFADAENAYRRAIALSQPEPSLLNNLGLALTGQTRDAEAMGAFRQALDTDPDDLPARFNLGRAYAALGQFAAAEQEFRHVLAGLPPDAPGERVMGAVSELARVLLDMGKADEALSGLEAAIARYPAGDASHRGHASLILLLLGRFAEGWAAYESRWQASNHETPHQDCRVLDLRDIAGKRVLVTEEQGRGDVIQFLRYIPRLAALGARVSLRVYPDLLPLAKELRDAETVFAVGDDEPAYDLRASIMSLPLAFGTDLASIPADTPYLRVPAARVGIMKHHLGAVSGPRVGLAWSGSAASQARAAMPVAALEPILRRPGITFHALQNAIRPEDRAWLDRAGLDHAGPVVLHAAELRDFGDTAALIESMDLVISIDTAVAHLAGALARPVWIMLAHNPDWRWLLGRDDSPWYPTARLFRQTGWRDWDSVVRQILAALPF